MSNICHDNAWKEEPKHWQSCHIAQVWPATGFREGLAVGEPREATVIKMMILRFERALAVPDSIEVQQHPMKVTWLRAALWARGAWKVWAGLASAHTGGPGSQLMRDRLIACRFSRWAEPASSHDSDSDSDIDIAWYDAPTADPLTPTRCTYV